MSKLYVPTIAFLVIAILIYAKECRFRRFMLSAYSIPMANMRGSFGRVEILNSVFLGLLVLSFVFEYIRLSALAEYALTLSCVIVAINHVFLPRIRKNALLKELLAKDYKICPVCHYELKHLPNNGQCPECGQRYDRRWLADVWNHIIRHT